MKFLALAGKLSIAILTIVSTPLVSLAAPLADGTYLFGQSRVPNKIGMEYLVFKVRGERVIGAIYAPMSEFSCFSGNFTGNRFNFAIRDPYDNQVYNHSIALRVPYPVAGRTGQPLGLEGLYRIDSIGSNDLRILQTCLKEMDR